MDHRSAEEFVNRWHEGSSYRRLHHAEAKCHKTPLADGRPNVRRLRSRHRGIEEQPVGLFFAGVRKPVGQPRLMTPEGDKTGKVAVRVSARRHHRQETGEWCGRGSFFIALDYGCDLSRSRAESIIRDGVAATILQVLDVGIVRFRYADFKDVEIALIRLASAYSCATTSGGVGISPASSLSGSPIAGLRHSRRCKTTPLRHKQCSTG